MSSTALVNIGLLTTFEASARGMLERELTERQDASTRFPSPIHFQQQHEAIEAFYTILRSNGTGQETCACCCSSFTTSKLSKVSWENLVTMGFQRGFGSKSDLDDCG